MQLKQENSGKTTAYHIALSLCSVQLAASGVVNNRATGWRMGQTVLFYQTQVTDLTIPCLRPSAS